MRKLTSLLLIKNCLQEKSQEMQRIKTGRTENTQGVPKVLLLFVIAYRKKNEIEKSEKFCGSGAYFAYYSTENNFF